ncbi:MAG: gamma-glutamylcyclotransferase family protein [Ilumatobacteraceae bacterium]
MPATWAFGYGSLVSPASLGATLGRPVRPGIGWAEAVLYGHGRRWNYGIGGPAGDGVVGYWTDADGVQHEVTMVALGIVVAAETIGRESINGVVIAVDDDELERLDRRERHYDRIDVTDVVEPDDRLPGPRPGDRVVTYLPRREAVERYENARDAGTAAIEQRYWDLVEGAFAALGPDRLDRYHRTTPPPDVPVRPIVRGRRPNARS